MDVIMAVQRTTDAARHATRTIPIVIAGGADPVASGLVTSLARPGGNITGMTFAPAEMAGKRLALLKGAFPLRPISLLIPCVLRTYSTAVLAW